MKKDLLVDAEWGNGFLLLRTEVGCEHERLVHLHVSVDQCPQFLLEYCLLSAPKLQMYNAAQHLYQWLHCFPQLYHHQCQTHLGRHQCLYFVVCHFWFRSRYLQFTETRHTVPDAVSFSCRVVSSCFSRVGAEHSWEVPIIFYSNFVIVSHYIWLSLLLLSSSPSWYLFIIRRLTIARNGGFSLSLKSNE